MKRFVAACSLIAATMLLIQWPAMSQSGLDKLAIEVKNESREFIFTNKQTAFYFGETNRGNTSSWHGFNVGNREILDDYLLLVDGEVLDRKTVLKTTVYPDHLVRTYPDGIVEQLRIVDSLPLFAVMITSKKAIDVSVIPLFTDGNRVTDFEVRLADASALVTLSSLITKQNPAGYPLWLAIHGNGFSPQAEWLNIGGQVSPVALHGRKSKTHVVSFAVGARESDAEALARDYLDNAATYFKERRKRMERLLHESQFATDNIRLNKALAWAKLSLDALILNHGTKGIVAGLPWFNNYWGRDTFIALPGATLVTGQFDQAKAILRSFAEFQQRDELSSDYGRIPNVVNGEEKAYNTADGTPRFVMMAREYVERSGDSAFVREIYPVVLRSIEGTLRYHADSLGFLTHGDAETWMDAVGPDGPWSPRGNRANDVQALWAKQLVAGIWFATELADVNSAIRWNEILVRLRRNFATHFVTSSEIADHLDSGGIPNYQFRPNQVFAAPLLNEALRVSMVHTVSSRLAYEHGVASLCQEEENFHPYHQLASSYPKDAAYHNGVVWTWLQGPLISELCRLGKQDLAFQMTSNAIRQILERGAVGTQSELLDALPRPPESEPRLSGTATQAWNLAEFVRNFYDDYAGIRLNRYKHHLVLRPRLPSNLNKAEVVLNLGGKKLPLLIMSDGDIQRVTIDGKNLRVGGTVFIDLLGKDGRQFEVRTHIPPNSTLTLELNGSELTLYKNGTKASDYETTSKQLPTEFTSSEWRLAVPRLRDDLRSVRGPDHPVIPHSIIKARGSHQRILVDTEDPAHDDVGSGAYTYPTNHNFRQGCLDLRQFRVSIDDEYAYFSLKFQNLSNPGWHPEYGFQLTFVAIAIDQDGMSGSGQQFVPQNARYSLPPEHAYERLILVGGGVRVEDAGGKILAEYIPSETDVVDPIGSSLTASISFALPLSYLGTPDERWTFTVLVGAQDDRGGAGLGEFRNVAVTASEWTGGGKKSEHESNVYDTLTVRAR